MTVEEKNYFETKKKECEKYEESQRPDVSVTDLLIIAGAAGLIVLTIGIIANIRPH